MDFFIRWIFGVAVDQPLDGAVAFKITTQDFGKFDGMSEHWYGYRTKMLSTLGVAGFSSILDQARPSKLSIHSDWNSGICSYDCEITLIKE